MSTFSLGPIELHDPLVLAPMEDVSTGPFRALCRRHGADLVFTEFIHAGTLLQRTAKSLEKIVIGPDEQPCGVQIFGEDVRRLADAALKAVDAGAAVVDLNIGCPVKKIVNKGAGAALLRDLDLTRRIIREIRRVVPDAVPVTAKARIGWDDCSINILELAPMLEGEGVSALSIHARTRVQQYTGRADWTWIGRAKAAVSIPVIGNGDVSEPEDVARMLAETGCDGVMIGRAAIGRPWFFTHARHYLDHGERLPAPSRGERIGILLDHLTAEVDRIGERRAVYSMRKQFGPYLKGMPDAPALRATLMGVDSIAGIRDTLTAGTSAAR
jgi:tRNA-dihydrouridine synthase B